MKFNLPKIRNTKLQGKVPFKTDKKRVAFVIFLIVGTIGAMTALGTQAKTYSAPFRAFLDFVRGFGISPGWSVVVSAVTVYLILTAFLFVNVYDQAAATARRNLMEPEIKKLHDWGTEHKLYKSTYDQIVSRMSYYNKTNASGSVIALMSIIQAPITIGLMYVLNHDSVMKHATFYGVSLSEKIVWIGVLVGFLYFCNSFFTSASYRHRGKTLMWSLIFAGLIGALMGFTVAKTAFGIGLYFLTGVFIVIIRGFFIQYIRPRWAKRLESKVEIKYDFEYMINNEVDIKFNDKGVALDYNTGEPGKIEKRSSFR